MSDSDEGILFAVKPITVFDCMTFLQATARPDGPAAACLRLVEEGRATLVVSEDILREVGEVLGRPKVRRKNPRLTDESVQAFLGQVRKLSPLRGNVPAAFRYTRDPKDEPYLNLAIYAKAAFIVTRDKDLLDLMDEGNADGKEFRTLVPSIQVLRPPDFLREIRSSEARKEASTANSLASGSDFEAPQNDSGAPPSNPPGSEPNLP
jgi:putative PIN family toxin of toxin-antitoxin system